MYEHQESSHSQSHLATPSSPSKSPESPGLLNLRINHHRNQQFQHQITSQAQIIPLVTRSCSSLDLANTAHRTSSISCPSETPPTSPQAHLQSLVTHLRSIVEFEEENRSRWPPNRSSSASSSKVSSVVVEM
ncbi:hypothetical protein ACLB2K_051707 [Fragaria x ananassa]